MPTIWFYSAQQLQKLMGRMSDMLECHQLLVNANKTKIVVFNRQSRDFIFRFKNNVIDLIDNIKYLGCVLNFKLCDDLDIDRCNVSFNRYFVFLFRKFNSVSIDLCPFPRQIQIWNQFFFLGLLYFLSYIISKFL